MDATSHIHIMDCSDTSQPAVIGPLRTSLKTGSPDQGIVSRGSAVGAESARITNMEPMVLVVIA